MVSKNGDKLQETLEIDHRSSSKEEGSCAIGRHKQLYLKQVEQVQERNHRHFG